MGETSNKLQVKLEDLMREQDDREAEQLEHHCEIGVYFSRSLSELLQEEEEINNTHDGVESNRREEEEKTMEGLSGGRRWRSLKQRLKIRGMGCCGSSWSFQSENRNMGVAIEGGEVGNQPENGRNLAGVENEGRMMVVGVDGCVGGHNPAGAEGSGGGEELGMNLGEALAAERNFRGAVQVGWPSPSLLLRLNEEEEEEEEEEERCCVCMVRRRKDAAFIPCGHTFCRVCSREIWVNRGSCPLCNGAVIDILHIF